MTQPTLIDARKIKIPMICNPEWDAVSQSEKGGLYRKWRGYQLYDNLPFAQSSGNQRMDPPTKTNADGEEYQPKQWIAVSEYVSKEEIDENKDEDGESKLKGDDIGFGFISENFNEDGSPNDSMHIVNAKLITVNGEALLHVPMSGNINEIEINGKIYLTCCLRCDQKTIDFWDPKLKETDEPYRVQSPRMLEENLMQIINAEKEDYEGFNEWYIKFFPKTKAKAIKNAVKRKSLLAAMVDKEIVVPLTADEEKAVPWLQ